MTRLGLASLAGSIILAALLIVVLFVGTDLDLAATGRLLLGLRPQGPVEIVMLMGLGNFLAGEKWRLVVLSLGTTGLPHLPRPIYFALSAIGVALSQILPVQLTTALSRSIGARAYGGHAISRGVGATIIEQLFDLFVAALFGLASVIVLLTGGSGVDWMLAASIAVGAGFALCDLTGPLTESVLRRFRTNKTNRLIGWLGSSGLLTSKIARRLFVLSLLRFAIFVSVWAVAADAVSLDIPLWQLAAAFPFATFATALAITPGGIGLSEWTASSMLVAFGTPFPVAAQWAIACRILVLLAAAVCGLAAIATLTLLRRSRALRQA